MQLNYVITQFSLNIVMLYIFFVIECIAVGLFLGIAKSLGTDKKISAFQLYSFKILSILGLAQNTILSILILNVYAVIFICDPNSPYSAGQVCYQGIYFVHLVVAAIGAIMYLLISLFYGLLYVDLKYILFLLSPFSETPFAGPQSKMTLYRLLLKTLILTYITLDY